MVAPVLIAQGIAEGVSLLLSLTQAANQLSQSAVEVGALIQKANAEGRDLTEEELNVARNAALAARGRLAAA